MKRLILLFLLLAGTLCSYAQQVETKDGVVIGERSDLISSCVEGVGSDTISSDGVSIPTSKMCACMVDRIFTQLTYLEILSLVMETGSEEKLMARYETILIDCIKSDISVESDYVFNHHNVSEDVKNVAIRSCATTMLETAANESIDFTETQAMEFCTCAIDKMLQRGYQFSDFLQLDDESSAVFNEVVLGCMEPLIGTQGLSENVYNPHDIKGNAKSVQVPLLNYASVGKKVKLTIGGIEKYFLFDTGASEVIITTDVERQLKEKGVIKESQYRGTRTFQLADGSMVEARMVELDDVRIGSYVVNNLTVAILDEGGMLCGMGLLNKFRDWEIKNNNTLILYK